MCSRLGVSKESESNPLELGKNGGLKDMKRLSVTLTEQQI